MRTALLLLTALVAGSPGLEAQTARQGILSLDDGRLFYEVVGAGAPIVLVHGGPGLDSRYLRPGLDALASLGSLVFYDQRGTGRSDVPLDSATIHLSAFLADIERLREALGHERITLVGHSFGALLALAYALEHPDRTRGLVLMNPAEPGTRWAAATAARARARRAPADSAEMAELATSEAFRAREAGAMSRYYRAAFRGSMRDPTRLERVNLELAPRTARNGPEVARLLGTSMQPLDWWDRLGRVEAPTLVVHGRYDIAPLEMSEALAEAIPRGRLAVLDTGHFPWVEDPAGLISEVTAFLGALGG